VVHIGTERRGDADEQSAGSQVSAPAGMTPPAAQIELSIVIPVFNQAGSIVDNVTAVRDRVVSRMDGPVELIVVSDGSIDRTEERLLESGPRDVRVFHYDRNLGKGYAIKIGALEARGRWVAYCDADLDLDPSALPVFWQVAERDQLDFVIGSKRHPESSVAYPRSRRVASWLYQQLVRLLFQLNVSDTQVGLKLFRRDVVLEVMPLLLVKHFAFDIELLAVAREFGFTRVREMPIRLDYQFSGSGVRAGSIALALLDTVAVFYRLRVIRTYQRKRQLVGQFGWARPSGYRPEVALVASEDMSTDRFDWPNVSRTSVKPGEPWWAIARRVTAELIAFIEPGAAPSGNFISATVPFLARREVAAVVTSKVAPAGGSLGQRVATAVRESRLGGGSLYFRFLPGNIRYVHDFPTASYVARRERLLELPSSVAADRVPEALAERGDLVVYTPESFVVVPTTRFGRSFLAETCAYGRERGRAFARRGFAALRLSTSIGLGVGVFLLSGWLLAFVSSSAVVVWLVGVAAYLVALMFAAVFASLRFRSAAVGLSLPPALALVHLAYAASFARGAVSRPLVRDGT
jgi:glycosyltransferase involved in cell wall biosynthesis